MVYGVYENQNDAEAALAEISGNLQRNAPLKANVHGNRVSLVPADGVHYVGRDEGERPIGWG
jgi:hypothetical protein